MARPPGSCRLRDRWYASLPAIDAMSASSGSLFPLWDAKRQVGQIMTTVCVIDPGCTLPTIRVRRRPHGTPGNQQPATRHPRWLPPGSSDRGVYSDTIAAPSPKAASAVCVAVSAGSRGAYGRRPRWRQSRRVLRAGIQFQDEARPIRANVTAGDHVVIPDDTTAAHSGWAKVFHPVGCVYRCGTDLVR